MRWLCRLRGHKKQAVMVTRTLPFTHHAVSGQIVEERCVGIVCLRCLQAWS